MLRWLLVAAVLIGFTVIPFLLFNASITAWVGAALAAARHQPASGAALIIGLLAADVLLPIPSSLVGVFAGSAFGWFPGAALVWLGLTLGCLCGYGLGRGAGRVAAVRVVGETELARASRLFENAGPVALVVTRAVPVLAEAGTLAAGAARMPLLPFLVFTGLGNAATAAAYAGIGAAAASSGSFLIAFLALASLPALGWNAWRIHRARSGRRRAGQAAGPGSEAVTGES